MPLKEVLVIALAVLYIPAECINIVSRNDWGAKSPTIPPKTLRNTPTYVVIHHSTGASCTDKTSCVSKLKNFQNDHIKNRDFTDIGYNFLIGEDGNIYEGRGWGKLGSHAKGYNSKSIGICIIGTYTSSPPNTKALQAVKDLIAHGVANSKIDTNYKLLGHRQTKSTACPGAALFDEIKTWPNWSATV